MDFFLFCNKSEISKRNEEKRELNMKRAFLGSNDNEKVLNLVA